MSRYHPSSVARGSSGRGLDDLKPKLARCREALTKWSTKEFKHNLVEITKVKHSLTTLARTTDPNVTQDEERALKSVRRFIGNRDRWLNGWLRVTKIRNSSI